MNTITLTSTPTPDLSAIDLYECAPSYKSKLRKATLALIASRVDPRNPKALRAYADTLPASGKAFLNAALRILFADIAINLKASATPQNVLSVQASLLNLEAMHKTLKVHQPDRERLPRWLTQEEVDDLLQTAFRQSLRDYIVIALLVGAGLRREELELLTFDTISTVDNQPIITLRGKGAKVRSIPITPVLHRHLQDWQTHVGHGRIARSIHKTGRVGASLSSTAIFSIVREYGSMIGISNLDPHDLRRTFGRLAYHATGDILKVRNLMGHSKTETTEHYIGLELDLEPVNIVHSDFVSVFGD